MITIIFDDKLLFGTFLSPLVEFYFGFNESSRKGSSCFVERTTVGIIYGIFLLINRLCYIILIITKFLRINKSIIYIPVAYRYNLYLTTCTVPGGETVLCPNINNLMGRL